MGLRIFRPLFDSFFDWYENHFADPNRDSLMHAALGKRFRGREFDAFIEDQQFTALITVPPLLGLFHGALIGPIMGALYTLTPEWNASASHGSIAGLLVTPLFLSLVYAAALAFFLPTHNEGMARSRRVRRWLLLVSPVFVIPAVFNCMRAALCSRRHSSA